MGNVAFIIAWLPILFVVTACLCALHIVHIKLQNQIHLMHVISANHFDNSVSLIKMLSVAFSIFISELKVKDNMQVRVCSLMVFKKRFKWNELSYINGDLRQHVFDLKDGFEHELENLMLLNVEIWYVEWKWAQTIEFSLKLLLLFVLLFFHLLLTTHHAV